jgi:hypothetical protein
MPTLHKKSVGRLYACPRRFDEILIELLVGVDASPGATRAWSATTAPRR